MRDRHMKDEHGDHVKPSDVTADHGSVVIDGPDGVAVSMTPDAALETSERLLRAGLEAHGQNVAAGIDKDRPEK